MNNTFYSKNDYRYYIQHHGIKGQQWGKRNGPPYPLSEKKHDKVIGKSTPEEFNKKYYYPKYKLKPVKQKKLENRIIKKERDNNTTNPRKKNIVLPSKGNASKHIALGVLESFFGVVGLSPAIMSIAVSTLKDGTNELKAYKANKTLLKDIEKDTETKNGLPLKRKEETPESDLSKVNPLYSFKGEAGKSPGSRQNCMGCTTTYDMRRRGYDVTAGLLSHGYQPADIDRWYSNAERKDYDLPELDFAWPVKAITDAADRKTMIERKKKDIDTLMSEVVKQGNGARGNIMVCWPRGCGGHSMVYEVVNNSMIIRDGQVNKSYTTKDDIYKCLMNTRNITTYRLDVAEPNIENLIEEGIIRWKKGQI